MNREILPLTGISRIAAGTYHSLALTQEGKVLAWGYNGYGQLGDGSTTSRYLPDFAIDSNQFPLENIAAIAASGNHSLALHSDGRVFSWGRNNDGQLGNGRPIDSTTARQVVDRIGAVIQSATTLAAGPHHNLARRSDGKLLAWGANNYGQLGDGSLNLKRYAVLVIDRNLNPIDNIGVPGNPTDPTLDSDGDGTPDVQDAFPYDPRYKVDTDQDGLPDEWEIEHFGNLTTANATTDTDGDGSTDSDEFKHGSDPKATLTVARSPIAAGDNHSLGLKVDGTLLAWGYNNYGQLGDGTTTNRSQPVTVKVGGTALTGLRSIAANGSHSLALKADGTVLAWGLNNYGQIGDGTTVNRSQPVTVQAAASVPLRGVVAVAAGNSHSLALKADGTVLAWGLNNYGQLGDGTTTNRSWPVLLTDDNGVVISGIIAIAAGQSHSLALKADGTVLAWGYNGNGQLGDGTNTTRYRVGAVLDTSYNLLTGIRAIAAGNSHSLALTADGRVLTWGYNNYGQLGDGSTANSTLPRVVIHDSYFPLQNMVAVAAGGNHSLALHRDGQVYSWGYNDNGQLGVGDRNTRLRAQAVLDSGSAVLTGINGIAAGSSHSLALRSTGTLLSWGDNAYGQLGNGTTSDRLLPVAVVDGNLQPVGLIGLPGDPTDPTLDSDGDGTRIARTPSRYDPRYKADTDQDGLPDEWEIEHFGNLRHR